MARRVAAGGGRAGGLWRVYLEQPAAMLFGYSAAIMVVGDNFRHLGAGRGPNGLPLLIVVREFWLGSACTDEPAASVAGKVD